MAPSQAALEDLENHKSMTNEAYDRDIPHVFSRRFYSFLLKVPSCGLAYHIIMRHHFNPKDVCGVSQVYLDSL